MTGDGRRNMASPFCPPTSSICSLVSSLSLWLPCRAAAFGDERVGEHELGFRHVLDRQQHLGGFAGRGVVAADARGVAFGAEQQAAESPPPIDRDRHFYAFARMALEIERRTSGRSMPGEDTSRR